MSYPRLDIERICGIWVDDLRTKQSLEDETGARILAIIHNTSITNKPDPDSVGSETLSGRRPALPYPESEPK